MMGLGQASAQGRINAAEACVEMVLHFDHKCVPQWLVSSQVLTFISPVAPVCDLKATHSAAPFGQMFPTADAQAMLVDSSRRQSQPSA